MVGDVAKNAQHDDDSSDVVSITALVVDFILYCLSSWSRKKECCRFGKGCS